VKENKADLHLHTTASDGLLSPVELINIFSNLGVKCISITDHDTIQGYLSVVDLAKESGIDLLPGVEITTNYKGKECHILAYAFDTENKQFLDFLSGQRLIRYRRAESILGKLNEMGYDIDIDDVSAESGMATISRNHIAMALKKKQFVATKREAFDRLLHSKGPAYVKNGYPEVQFVLELIKSAGGVSFLAHPGMYYIYEDLKFFLNNGIDGIEYIHPSHNYKTQKKLKDYATNYNLLLSGGSDFHGIRPYEIQYLGTVCVDRLRVEKIIEKSGSEMFLNAV
jgi:3',5'-nucleoside bisphosphate phosphatase